MGVASEKKEGDKAEIDYDPLVKVEIRRIDRSTIIMNPVVRQWCCLPYPHHPKGCPNYGGNPLCPPKAPYRPDILRKYDEFHIATIQFDICKYVELRKQSRPDDSDAQLRNLWHWQHAVKRRLRDAIKSSQIKFREVFLSGAGAEGKQSMESAGVFVFATLQRNGIKFDRKARDSIVLVALLCGYKQLDLIEYLKSARQTKESS